MKFFFYADNLNPTQLKRRAPEHRFVSKAYLPDHTLHFCRWSSQWRSGLASVAPTPGERVWGVICEITDEDLKLLDEFEGEVPQGAYRHLQVTVITEEEEKILVTTHAATPIG
ncbi:MAG: gamma-glutamylcyclotransferase family protein, partial [Nitrospiraceae bacterium]